MSPPDRFRVSRDRPDGRSRAMDFDFSEVLAAWSRQGLRRPPHRRASRRRSATRARSCRWRASRCSTAQQTREVVYSILNDDQRKRFENHKQLDFAYAIPGVARFRVNCFFQRGSVSAAFRLVPQEIPALDSLGVPQVLRELTAKPRGFVLVTGPTGSGKCDDAGGDDRRDQQRAPGPHPHDRGPDRVPPPAQAARSSTSARSAPTRRTSPSACGPPCARTPT